MRRNLNGKILPLLILTVWVAGSLPVCAEDISPAQAKMLREQIVAEAKKHIGAPYAYGGQGPDSFDCSGFVDYCAHVSIQYELERTAQAMYSDARIVPDAKREAGDLVFFKTTGSGTISHVGIYIGKKQFIHAASDGPNNGVIVSSLNEAYWGGHYCGTGQFLPSGRSPDETDTDDEVVEIPADAGDGAPSSNPDGTPHTGKISKKNTAANSGGFADKFLLEGTLTADWSLFLMNRFMPDFRGVSSLVYASYSGWTLDPGIGIMFRYNAGVRSFQLPIVLGLTFNQYVRAYAGPVFNFGSCTIPGTNEPITSSFFPGIIGISICTPSVIPGKVQLTFMQDINYTVYNATDNAALPFGQAFVSGFEFSTGIRIVLPLSVFTR